MRLSFSIPGTWAGRLVAAVVVVALLAGFVFFFVAAMIVVAVLIAIALVRRLLPARRPAGTDRGTIIDGDGLIVRDAEESGPERRITQSDDPNEGV